MANIGINGRKNARIGGKNAKKVDSWRTVDKTNDCRPLSLRRCVTPAGFMVEDQMFDRKLRKLAYGFLRVSLLRSD